MMPAARVFPAVIVAMQQRIVNKQFITLCYSACLHIMRMEVDDCEESTVKIANTYRVREPIENLKIRIRIAQQTSRLAELFDNEEETRDTNFLEYEERIVSWQEKIFSSFETGFYSDLKNCKTELQKLYHEEITKNNTQGSRIYTYTEEDAFYPDNYLLVNSDFKSPISRRNSLALPVLKNLKPFCQRYNKKVIDEVPDDSRIRTNHYLYKDVKVMHVLADLSPKDKPSYDFNDSEILLCTITFDKTRNSLNLNPDFTREEHIYRIQGTDMGYDYWIEHISIQQNDNDLEIQVKELGDEVMQKLSFREAEIISEIGLPPSKVLRLYINLEIISAQNFSYDALFVTYHIQLPVHWSIDKTENLTGRTQRCSKKNGKANFSYVAEFCLSCIEGEETWPWIFISVASLDSWTRYRIEGYAALPIPFAPGSHKINLQTWRPLGDFLNTLRRFFTGGTYELDDISYCGIPGMQDGSKLEKNNLQTAPSGQVELKINVAQQSRSFIQGNFKRDTFERLSAGRLINSVNNVLEQFKAARERMIRARIMSS